jgi:hypothetical protein
MNFKFINPGFYNKIRILLLILLTFNIIGTKDIYAQNDMKNFEKTKANGSFIKKIESFNEIDFKNYFSKEKDLVLFDIDHTILRPDKLYAEYIFSNDQKCNKKILELKSIHIDKIDFNHFLGFIAKSSKMQIIEPDIIEKIKFLKENSIHLIAITGMPTGFNSALKDSWQNWRFEYLKNIGFEGSFSDIAFTLDIKEFEKRPIFYKGIIFTDFINKGKALKLFLENINKLDDLNNSKYAKFIFLEQAEKNLEKYKNFNLKPERIIMFDDSEEYLNSVLKVCEELKIEFHGYHYKPYEIMDWTSESEEEFNIFLKEIIKDQKKNN